jgi:hypothetical protein
MALRSDCGDVISVSGKHAHSLPSCPQHIVLHFVVRLPCDAAPAECDGLNCLHQADAHFTKDATLCCQSLAARLNLARTFQYFIGGFLTHMHPCVPSQGCSKFAPLSLNHTQRSRMTSLRAAAQTHLPPGWQALATYTNGDQYLPPTFRFDVIFSKGRRRFETKIGQQLDVALFANWTTVADMRGYIDQENDRSATFRDQNNKIYERLTKVFTPVERLSSVVAAGTSVGSPPAGACLGAVALLIRSAQNVSSHYDRIIGLFHILTISNM